MITLTAKNIYGGTETATFATERELEGFLSNYRKFYISWTIER